MEKTVTPMLKLNKLNYYIADTQILSDIGFQVEEGALIAVVGPNGAGKTTLLKLISGQYPSEQQVFWHSKALENLSAITRAKQIAVVNQFNASVFNLNLEQIVSMGLLPHQSIFSKVSSEQKARVTEAIAQVGLREKSHQLFSSLSGGEQQRGQIARALVQGAGLFVLDEPINHLDVYYEHQILSLLRKIAKQNKVTIVMSLHDLNHAADYCDKIALLAQGQLLAFGYPKDVLTQQRLQQVFKTPCQIIEKPGANKIRIEFYPPDIDFDDYEKNRGSVDV
ncbi:ABC transporter ATP-binding protein [Aliiglaciecola sp. NS0011-25]|uniref:ABC transporter ATP-binding protein n=2 Tax=Alteromonadaceae TaxID=72275 RepID=UPI0031058C08